MTVMPFPFRPDPLADFAQQMAERIRQTIDRINSLLQTAGQIFTNACRAIAAATLGLAAGFLEGLAQAFNRCLQIAVDVAVKINEFVDWLQGPANIEAVGKAITETYPTPLTELGTSILQENLQTNTGWSGEGADAFFASASRQKGAVDGIRAVVTSLGTTMTSVGASGKAILTGFIIAVTGSAVTMIVAITATCVFPPAAGVTVPICLAVIAFILAIAVATVVAANNVAQAISNAETSFETQLPEGSEWPKGVGGGGRAANDAETDGSVADGDNPWSTEDP